MYMSRDPRQHHEVYFALVRDIVQAAPSTWPYIENINNQILTGELYKALKEAKKLIAYEQELLEHAKRGPSLRKRSQQTASPRDLEGNCCCRRPPGCRPCTTPGTTERASLDDALLYNRKLWSMFLTSVTEQRQSAAGRDPPERRQSRLFVMNQTLAVMGDPRPEQLRA